MWQEQEFSHGTLVGRAFTYYENGQVKQERREGGLLFREWTGGTRETLCGWLSAIHTPSVGTSADGSGIYSEKLHCMEEDQS